MSAVAQLGVTLDQPMPQSPDAERAVLGSILINNHAFYRVIGTIDTDDFFNGCEGAPDAHRVIFGAMRRMADQSRAIETLTLKDDLAKHAQLRDAGGVAYISALLDAVPDIANVERYAEIVKEKSMLRRLIVHGNRVMRAAADAQSESRDVLAVAEQSLYGIAENSAERGFATLSAITRTNMVAIESLHANPGRLVTGLPTGYARFDEMTSGFQQQDLIILAARPSMGKTSLMTNIAEAIAIPDSSNQPRCGDRLYRVGVFSLEMSKEQIGLRILSSESGVSSHLIRQGMLSQKNWSELAAAASRIAKGAIHIDDTPGLDPLELRARAKRLQREVGLDVVMIDYLQLMTMRGKVESRQQEVSQISRGLKAVAKELNVPVLTLSQLSRRPEQRAGDHRPQLADLRDSGAIEQDADLVAFIYRDEVYNKDSEDKGIAEIIIAKQRNGPIGDFKLVFRNDLTKFFNYEPAPDFVPAASARGDEREWVR